MAKWRFIKVILSFSSYDTMGWEGGHSFYPSEIPSRIDRDEVTGLARRETRNPEFEEKSRGGSSPPSRPWRKWWPRINGDIVCRIFMGSSPNVAKITPASLSRSKTKLFRASRM